VAWQAERVVDEPLVTRLLGQVPGLEVASLRKLSEGWDRSVWLVNGELVFGFPRREVVVGGIEREIELLPRLAPLLPLAVPVPAFVGRPTADFPWPFFGSPVLPGREAADARPDDDVRTSVGVELAAFLRRLHGPDVARALPAEALPLDLNRRADMKLRVPMARESLDELERLGLWRRSPRVRELLREAEQLPPSRSPLSVAHGDLHFRHVLIDGGRASGVIDWIDLCRADPAVDLPLLWSFVPPSGRGAFLDAYGPVDDAQLLRARLLALFLAATLARYGRAEAHAAIEREALAGLERALAD
jgi:aminoglycoside phosphotransferase (APT) family kinase protein